MRYSALAKKGLQVIAFLVGGALALVALLVAGALVISLLSAGSPSGCGGADDLTTAGNCGEQYAEDDSGADLFDQQSDQYPTNPYGNSP